MPLHRTLEEKWELLLQTIAADPSFKVTEVTDDEVCFTAPRLDAVQELKKLLANSDLLKKQIIHILSNDENEPELADTKDQLQPELKAQAENPLDLLKQLFTKDFLAEIGFKDSAFYVHDNQNSQTAEIELITTTVARSELETAKLEILRCSIPDEGTLTQILHDKAPPIGQESECTETTYGKKLINIKEEPDGTKSVMLNYGKILQSAQAGHFDGSAPIIAVSGDKDNNEYSINKDYVLQYLYSILNGAIFNKEQGDSYLPILFEPDSLPVPNCAFHMVIDISGSMAYDFREYQLHIKNIIQKIIETVNDWQFTITTFNDDVISQKFFSSNNNIEQINNFINQLSADGRTNLYGAMYDSIKTIPIDSHSTMILITDGHDNIEAYTPEKIITVSSELQQKNPQFTMYTMGLGKDYSVDFFNTISKQIGFTHIDLANIEDLNSFHQYIDSIGKYRIWYEFFIDAAQKYAVQVPAGEIVVGDPIAQNAKIVKAGKMYDSFGVVKKLTEVVSKTYANVSATVSKAIDAVLHEAVTYAQDVTHNTGYFPNIDDPNYHYWATVPSSFDPDGICYLNGTMSPLIGQGSEGIGLLPN